MWIRTKCPRKRISAADQLRRKDAYVLGHTAHVAGVILHTEFKTASAA